MVVATPDAALAVASEPQPLPLLLDLRTVVVDEVDAVLEAFPATVAALLDMAISPHRGYGGSSGSSASGGGGDGSDSSRPAVSLLREGDDGQLLIESGDGDADGDAPIEQEQQRLERQWQEQQWQEQVRQWQQSSQRQRGSDATSPGPASSSGAESSSSPLEEALAAAQQQKRVEQQQDQLARIQARLAEVDNADAPMPKPQVGGHTCGLNCSTPPLPAAPQFASLHSWQVLLAPAFLAGMWV